MKVLGILIIRKPEVRNPSSNASGKKYTHTHRILSKCDKMWKTGESGPSRWLSWLEHHPTHQMFSGSIPSEGAYGRQLTDGCLSLSINEYILGWGFKKNNWSIWVKGIGVIYIILVAFLKVKLLQSTVIFKNSASCLKYLPKVPHLTGIKLKFKPRFIQLNSLCTLNAIQHNRKELKPIENWANNTEGPLTEHKWHF